MTKKVYCRSFALVMCNALREAYKESTKGLKGLLEYGKLDTELNADQLLLLSLLATYSSGGADIQLSCKRAQDWVLRPITLIALTEEVDLLHAALEHFFNFLLVSLLLLLYFPDSNLTYIVDSSLR